MTKRRTQLERGTAIEAAEHPGFSWEQAEQIAADHLREDPDYYKRRRNPAPGNLPPKAARMLSHVYESERERGLPPARASAAAWAAVKRDYYKRGGRWHRRKQRKRTANPGARAPIALSKLQDVSEHGRVLDLVVRQGDKLAKYTFRGARPLLTWSPKADALVWWEGVKVPASRRANALPKETAAVWKRFHGRAPTSMRVANVPDDPGPWKRLGPAVRIGYSNRKRWDRPAEHDFDTGPVVYRAGTRAPYLWIVRGGKLRMTARGIEG